MTKTHDNLVIIGAIMGAHGVRGDVRVKSFTAVPEDVFSYGPLLDKNGKPLIDPVSARPAKDHFIVRPAITRQKEEWDSLRRTDLYVPRSALPDADEDEFYITDLIGLPVYGGGDEAIGTVKDVQNHGAGDLLEIDPSSGAKTVLVPFTRADVPLVDMTARKIVVSTFDIWADESKPPQEEV